MKWPNTKPIDNGFMAAHKQFVFAVVIEVECGTPDIGAVHNVLNRYCLVSIFAYEFDQRLLQKFVGALYSTVSFCLKNICVSETSLGNFLNNLLKLFTNVQTSHIDY